MTALVAIGKSPKNPTVQEIKQILEENISLIGGLEKLVNKDSRVLLKPNASVSAAPEAARNTDARLIEAVILLLKELNPKKIIIGESAIIGADTMDAYKASGILDAAHRSGVKIVDFKKESFSKLKVNNSLILDTIQVADLVGEVDVLINLPKLKTIPSVPVSIGLKNLKGLLPDSEKKRFHYTCLNKAIVDLNKVVKTHLTIVDGILASEMYEPKEMNVIILGYDILAVDKAACRVMGVDPEGVKYLTLAKEAGIGTGEYNIVSKDVSLDEIQSKFKTAPSSSQAFAHLFPEVNIIDGNACSGCNSALYMALKRLKTEGLLVKLSGITLVIGKNMDCENKEDDAFYIGNCVKSLNKEPYVCGCPFTSMELYESLKNYKPLIHS